MQWDMSTKVNIWGYLKVITIIAVVALYVYHTSSLTLFPVIPSGDDTFFHIYACIYQNFTTYLFSDLQYPNFIHMICHITTGQNILHAILFFKLFNFTITLLPILLLLYELRRIEPRNAIPLALAIWLYGVRYLQTLSDGSIFNIFAFAMYISSIILLLHRHYFYAGLVSGFALIHYYGIVYVITLIPAVFLVRATRRFILGLLIGLLPSFHKWVYLVLAVLHHGEAVSGVTELPGWTLQNYLSYAFTPFTYWGEGAFYIYIAVIIILLIRMRNRSITSKSTLLSLSPALIIITALILPIISSQLVAVVTLIFRIFRLLPLVIILMIILLLQANTYRRYDKIIVMLLVAALIVGITTNLTATPQGLYRINYNAFYALLSLKQEICEGGVLAVGGITNYMQIICPDTVFLYPPEILAKMSPHDPQAILMRQVLAQFENGTIHGYRWLVVQEPIPGQWYDTAIKPLVESLKKKRHNLGNFTYIIYNEGVPIYIIKLR